MNHGKAHINAGRYAFDTAYWLILNYPQSKRDYLLSQVAQYQNEVEKLAISWNGNVESAKSIYSGIANPAVATLKEDQKTFMALAVPEPLATYRDKMKEGMEKVLYALENFTEGYTETLNLGKFYFDEGYKAIMAYQVTP